MTPGPIPTRLARQADLDAMVDLLGELFSIEADFEPRPELQRRGLKTMLAMPDRCILMVAEIAGEVVGMVSCQMLISTAQGGPVGLIEDMVVAESQRGRGIGRVLLGALEAEAVQRGFSRLQLLADRDNAPALAFYEKQGWARTLLEAWRRFPG